MGLKIGIFEEGNSVSSRKETYKFIENEATHWRVYLREPVAEIAIAACVLNNAATAHIDGQRIVAANLIERANIPAIMEWAQSLVGKNSEFNTPRFLRESHSTVPVAARDKKRMASPDDRLMLHHRYGYHCCFCGTPIIRKQIRNLLLGIYESAIPWTGLKEWERHPAFYVMNAQYDHVVPYSRGGETTLENLVLTCYPCNFGRNRYTLEEMGLLDPRIRKPVECVLPGWDGLERLLRQ